MENGCSHLKSGNRLITGIFLVFLVVIGVENQVHMPAQIRAYQNDAYIQRLRETLRREFLDFTYQRPGALDVRGGNTRIRLKQIMKRLDLNLPETLELFNGPAGKGRLVGWGHPFLGGKAEKTAWLLVPGIPGGSLELRAAPSKDPAS